LFVRSHCRLSDPLSAITSALTLGLFDAPAHRRETGNRNSLIALYFLIRL